LLALLILLTLCLTLLTACDTGSSSGSTTYGPSGSGTSATAAPCQGSDCAPGAGAGNVQVFVEPDAGETPVLHALEGAQQSVWVEVYLLTDRNVIQALEDAANRGVTVRVLLELHPYGSGATSPQQTLDELQAAGAQVEGADPAFHYTHEKALIIDGATLYVMSCNLTRSALGGSSGYTPDRDYGVIDTSSPDVAEAQAIFNADWTRTTPTLADPNLVVSPVNARAKITAFIAAAKHTLSVEDEEMYDTASEDELIAAAKRGVIVEVILPAPTGGASASPDVARLEQGGVRVRYITTVYMHAKLLIADNAEAFVGSENFSANSLDDNRELGLLIADPAALTTLGQTFATDWQNAQNAA